MNFPAGAIHHQLDKILCSRGFANSARMSRFLRFVVEQALAGQNAREYLVGVEVFDRPRGYDPRLDPIVRVEARRLRSKLDAYYQTLGSDDQLLIEVPTGGYRPRFSPAGHASTRALEEPRRAFSVGNPVTG
jgi:hypothetical protein